MTKPEVKFAFGKLLNRFTKINDAVFGLLTENMGCFEGEVFASIVAAFRVAVKPLTAHLDDEAEIADNLTIRKSDVLADSFRCHHGTQVTEEFLKFLVWRVAAGFNVLYEGRVLRSAFQPGVPQWLPLMIMEVAPGKPSMNGKAMVSVTFMVLDGVYGGLSFTHRLPHVFVVHRMAEVMGFPKYKRPHFRELVQCVLLGLVALQDPQRVIPVVELGESDSAKQANRKLRKARKVCAFGYTRLCQDCIRGYSGRSPCQKAARPRTLVERECKRTHDHNAWFDPKSVSKYCEGCREVLFFRRTRFD